MKPTANADRRMARIQSLVASDYANPDQCSSCKRRKTRRLVRIAAMIGAAKNGGRDPNPANTRRILRILETCARWRRSALAARK